MLQVRTKRTGNRTGEFQNGLPSAVRAEQLLILGQADTTLIRNVDGVSELVTDLEKQTSAKIETSKSNELPDGMVLIPGGTFTMGAVGNLTLPREYPRHPVKVSSFYMDAHEVTNAEFREFVQATGYITIAERPIDWEELKKQVAAWNTKTTRREP
jgi:formylglycine-generating enzyme required for sulfatase activity